MDTYILCAVGGSNPDRLGAFDHCYPYHPRVPAPGGVSPGTLCWGQGTWRGDTDPGSLTEESKWT